MHVREKQEAENMKVEITSKEIIKPSSLNPNEPRSFKLSFLDQFAPPCYIRCIYFYRASGLSTEEKSQCLKSSLSETLTKFWPFAGRITANSLISYDKNDGGVEYSEARVLNSVNLWDILEKPEDENLKHLIPNVTWYCCTNPLIIIQASFFGCGGMALGVCISHKISDGTTYATFMNSWASTARGCPSEEIIFNGNSSSTLFPPKENFLLKSSSLSHINQNGITKRFVFSASKIATLQAKASSLAIKCPTRVEVVSSLLWKTAMNASRLRAGLMRPPSPSIFSINLRRKMSPPLPDHSIGNLFMLQAMQPGDYDVELSELVCLIRGGIGEVQKYCGPETQGAERVSMCLGDIGKGKTFKFNEDIIDRYVISSWCRFPIYETDFGWGSPVWIGGRSFAGIPNTIVLMDNKDGSGIEAWVTLIAEDMDLFRKNEELLTFSSFNPSIKVVTD